MESRARSNFVIRFVVVFFFKTETSFSLLPFLCQLIVPLCVYLILGCPIAVSTIVAVSCCVLVYVVKVVLGKICSVEDGEHAVHHGLCRERRLAVRVRTTECDDDSRIRCRSVDIHRGEVYEWDVSFEAREVVCFYVHSLALARQVSVPVPILLDLYSQYRLNPSLVYYRIWLSYSPFRPVVSLSHTV